MPIHFAEAHIENTNACGYKCVMCPRESHTRKIGYMTVDDFSLVLDRLKDVQWLNSKEGMYHLHGYGEPLLDRDLVTKIALLNKQYPNALSLIFTTLGVRVKENYFANILESGLSAMVISMYGFTKEEYAKVHGNNGFDRVKQNLQLLSHAMKTSPTSTRAVLKVPHTTMSSTLPIAEAPQRSEFIAWAQKLGFPIEEWTYLHNYGDGRNYNISNKEKTCPVVTGRRKHILNITWDLKVVPCCYDYNASIPFGDLRTQSLEEIFSGPEYLSFTLAQKTNELSRYSICQNCEKQDYSPLT